MEVPESDNKEKKSTIKTRTASISKRKKDKLPWWVEILFVQLRLPETLLIKFLDARKDSAGLINQYRKEIKIVLVFVFLLIYINPIILLSKRHNICINSTLEKLSGVDNKSRNDFIAKAINYCNGGIEE